MNFKTGGQGHMGGTGGRRGKRGNDRNIVFSYKILKENKI